jgi:hypothetical protein
LLFGRAFLVSSFLASSVKGVKGLETHGFYSVVSVFFEQRLKASRGQGYFRKCAKNQNNSFKSVLSNAEAIVREFR